MINIILETPDVKNFNNLDLSSIIQRDRFGEKDFQDAFNHLEPIQELLNEELELIKNNNIPTHLQNNILSYINRFNSIIKVIKTYGEHPDHKGELRQNLINTCIKWHSEIFEVNRHPQDTSRNEYFLLHYLTVKNLSQKGRDKEFEELSKRLKKNVLESDALLDGVKEKLKENIVSEYAEIFQRQADKHSSFEINIGKDRVFKFGASQIWLLVSLAIIISLISALLSFKENFPLNKQITISSSVDLKTNKKAELFTEVLDYEHLATRVLIVSICLFLLVLSIRQFTINKHLAILNRHRQNALQSYKLFELSMNKDSSSKDALLLEVAKAIYDAGSTGYLTGKDSSPTSSIIELTRIINGNKEH